MGRWELKVRDEKRNEKIDELYNKVNELGNQIFIKYKEILKKELKLAGDMAIDEYYSDPVFDKPPYTEPSVYKRTYDLYNAYKIRFYKNNFTVKFDSDNLKNHQNNGDYIFERMFVEGYHGGDDFKINGYHPNPGEPWWHYSMTSDGENKKSITKGWQVWIKPAPQSDSPYENVVSRINFTINDVNERMNNEYKLKVMKLINKYKKYF